MELELKHLATYLSNKLKCTRIKGNDNKFRKDFGIKELIGLSFNTNRECFVGVFQNTELDINQIVPFLHPLSDLTKEIEVNGKKFIPIEELLHEINSLVVGGEKYSKKEMLGMCNNSYYSESWITDRLTEWHFDIFGLIDDGLAVDINTVKF